MRIIAILCLFLSVNAYSQNIYQIAKSTSRRGLRVNRTITVSPVHVRAAERVLAKRTLIGRPKISMEVGKAVISAKMKQPLVHPMRLSGGYNYLRTVNKKFKLSPQWKGVTDSGLYNGVHHIVTQTVIDAIAKEVDIADTKEMKANAPAVYSPLHGNILYTDFFHDHTTLLNTYHARGIRGIITDFYKNLNKVHQELGIPIYEKDVIDCTLAEAELWAKRWEIRWE